MPYAFLSYAHESNLLPYPNWVGSFTESLGRILRARLLRRAGDEALWFDADRLTGGMKLRDEIDGALRAASALVCLVDGHYLASDYTLAELDTWTRQNQEAVFRVGIDDVPLECLPDAVRAATEILFHTRGIRFSKEQPEYLRAIVELANGLAERLRSAPAPAAFGRVWLAPASAGVSPLRHTVSADLRSRGVTVGPAQLGPGSFEGELAALQGSRVALFILGTDAPPEDVPALFERARALAEADELDLLLWLPPSPGNDQLPDWAQAAMLAGGRIEVLDCDMEDLVDSLTASATTPAVSPAAPGILAVQRGVGGEAVAEAVTAMQEALHRPVSAMHLTASAAELAALRARMAVEARGAPAVVVAGTTQGGARAASIVVNQWLAGVADSPKRRVTWVPAEVVVVVPPAEQHPWPMLVGPASQLSAAVGAP